jgi:hypothetical protein
MLVGIKTMYKKKFIGTKNITKNKQRLNLEGLHFNDQEYI